MNVPRSTSKSLAGGYRLDADLPAPPADALETLGGLHVLRHMQRHLDTLGQHLVLFSDREYSELLSLLTSGYDQLSERRELRRHRFASSPSRMREVLRNDPRAVPVVSIYGSTCLGWKAPAWEGIRLSRYLQPGQLFAFAEQFTSMLPPRRPEALRLHLAEWQAPFPAHSMATWGNQAKLLKGPQEFKYAEIASYMFDTASKITNAPDDRLPFRRWRDSVAQGVGETAHPVSHHAK